MSHNGFILSNTQIIRDNHTNLIFQGRLSDGRRFHWTVTRPGIVFFMNRYDSWMPAGAFRKEVDELKVLPKEALKDRYESRQIEA